MAATADEAVELVLWSWLPDFQAQVDLFQAAHPNFKVKLVNAGQGNDEYTKLRAGLKAGSGLPDVCHIEFQLIRSFRQLNALANIGEWANRHKGEFAEWCWNQVSQGDKVYSMPWDSGPIAVLYRKDIFDQHNIAFPKELDEFAEQAIRLHEAAPEVYLTDATFSDGGWVNSLLWQAGCRPFEVNGTEISIQVNGESRAVENPPPGGVRVVFAGQHRLEPFLDHLAPGPLDSGDAGVQRRGDPAVAPAFARIRYVRLQEDARLRQQLGGTVAVANRPFSSSRSSASSLTTYFLTAISFPATNHLHRCLAATEIKKFPS